MRETGEGGESREIGNKRQEMGVGRQETGDVVGGNKEDPQSHKMSTIHDIFCVVSADSESFKNISQHHVTSGFLPSCQ